MNTHIILSSSLIKMQAGNGGNGKVSFFRGKREPKGGPDGGNGGNGGSIILQCSRSIDGLDCFHDKRYFFAENGENGMNKDKYGRNAKDLYIKLPMGTEVYDEEDSLLVDLVNDNQEYVLARGGHGGKGNMHMATPVCRTPQYAEPGTPGEERHVRFKLKIIADIGLIGLPNSGKSSLINCLTNCHSPVGPYSFTTLYAHLGTLINGQTHLRIVDIPGLIKDCSKGKGHGIEFLQNIERAAMLCFVIDGSLDYMDQYHTLITEITHYSPKILEKKQLIVVNKIDLIHNERKQSIDDFFKKNTSSSIIYISTLNHSNIDEVKKQFLNMTERSPNSTSTANNG